MGYTQRKSLYEQCESLRDKPLISYVTSIRQNMSSSMASDSITSIIEQINKIPANKKAIDLLIISNGGDPITALRIATILRERFDQVSVLIPYVAFSAATILALGANEIVMHPFSNLGPVDPQLSVVKQNGIGQQTSQQFSSEDIRNYIEFVRADVGISDQAQLLAAFNFLANDVGPIPIGSSRRSQQLSLSLSTKMLESHMEDKNKAASIAKALNTSYYHHGYAVGRKEAKQIGLNVITPDKQLENLLWEIWQDFCNEMKCNQAFEPISEIMNNPITKQILSNIQTINIPVNTPPDVANNIMSAVAQQNITIQQQTPFEITCPIAAIESTRAAFGVNQLMNFICWRDINMAISYNISMYSKGWEQIN